ncbi:hypothetical protein ISN45_At03g035020 [Arabidopsis thaliana x Arabidopsis arenosa]|uniref:Uncharacterized protein n=1 Tax=Arabidopsis thaliana x Arabidopsis arenosa TaxID=1240361 RepID=A0A8T2ETI0_9BRAS|nr:hypothetical protein ISN45_At03g035020 [Arabidopsis thaliana x Arabidopsis arenosa]
MTSYTEVVFHVYHGGYWVKHYTGDLSYLDGHEMKSITCKLEEFFTVMSTEMSEELDGQKIWYKLPFEEAKQQKSLSNVDISFKNMCETGKWVGFLDVYLVNSIEHPHDMDVNDPFEEEIRVERNMASFVDEDPNFDYNDTPPNSNDEDRGEQFVRFRMGIQ